MIVASHQPHFNPYLGYFAKMRLADVFILSDDVQFIKNGYIHRNKIRSWQGADGWRWLTVPVHYDSKMAIRDVTLAKGDWAQRLLNILYHEYRSAPFFGVESIFFRDLTETGTPFGLSFANFACLTLCLWRVALGVSSHQLKFASKIDYEAAPGDKNGRLIALTKAVGGTAYLAGSEAARVYLDPDRFRAAGITLLGLEYLNPQYPQLHGGFLPKMGVIDALMNVGQGVRPLIGEEFCRIVELT